jgi:hypothetical protein
VEGDVTSAVRRMIAVGVGLLLLAGAGVFTRAALWEGPVATESGGPGCRSARPRGPFQYLRTSGQVLRLPPGNAAPPGSGVPALTPGSPADAAAQRFAALPAAALWVPDIRFTSCDLRVLMDQPTESISSHDPPSRHEGRWFAGPERWGLPQGAVRAVAVVVVGVLGQYSLQLPASHDQHPVQHLPPNRTHPPLRIGIRPGRPHRRDEHP